MPERELMTGNDALAEAAIRAGCRFYYGYPITPQSELMEYMAARLREVGGTFLQCESELAAINCVFGTAAAGGRVMTSSSSPGISLMQEGISYMAACELPAVIVNVQRGGPGLGNVAPAQSDYHQATRGGGHGDYRTIVLAPHTIQEVIDLVPLAFDLAEKYRTPLIYLLDGQLAQMQEVAEMRTPFVPEDRPKPWALTGCKGREPNKIRSLLLDPDVLEGLNRRLQERYREIEKKEQRWEAWHMAGAEVAMVAFGTAARLCKEAIRELEAEGIRAGLIRPITLWPFPTKAFASAMERVAGFVVVEMSCGQLVEDVKLVTEGRRPIRFVGRTGGNLPAVSRIVEEVRSLVGRRERSRIASSSKAAPSRRRSTGATARTRTR